MARVRTWYNHSRPARATLIWLISALLFIFFFKTICQLRFYSPSAGTMELNSERRSKLYDKMGRDLDEHGAAFLKHGETSQSLSLSDLFDFKDGIVRPKLKPADPPVRANVLYLSKEYSMPISIAVKSTFLPYFDKVVWFQNSSFYHFSMFHASHHLTPVPATEEEIVSEMNAVQAVAEEICSLRIILDRVVLTSTGVLLGCWQVVSGTDPVTIRGKLRSALPRAPEKQLYDVAMLHTSFARLLGPPTNFHMELNQTSDQLHFFHKLVRHLNDQIRGMEAVVSELWYVEELDVLALALEGRMKIHKFQLGCRHT
ncbi:hypothetical protein RJ641_009312 [Dillenia turbinata]|uniref:Uncharacterized protein n=1 Tax=Dillenia turbinata TaxID=194707 RepID=A0AAN8V7I8_9MAGN